MPNSRAIRRWDHPLRLKVFIVICMSILSRFITAIRGLKSDPGCNDYLHLKMAGFDSPTPGWFSPPADSTMKLKRKQITEIEHTQA